MMYVIKKKASQMFTRAVPLVVTSPCAIGQHRLEEKGPHSKVDEEGEMGT